MYKIFVCILIGLSIRCQAQHQFEALINNLPVFDYTADFEKLVKYQKINAEKYNALFIPEKDEYFYGLNGEKESDGISGKREDALILNSIDDNFNPVEVVHHNEFWLNGLLDLSSNFHGLILTEETSEFINVNLYMFDIQGEMLSAIVLMKYSRDEDGKIDHTIIRSTVDKQGVIHQITAADFIIDRKFKIDNDGHLRITEEKVMDFE